MEALARPGCVRETAADDAGTEYERRTLHGIRNRNRNTEYGECDYGTSVAGEEYVQNNPRVTFESEPNKTKAGQKERAAARR